MATNTPLQRFSEIVKLPYKDQAIWFLNGFWGNPITPKECNQVWDYVQKFVELDLQGADKKGALGNELDQFWSAKFLESCNQTLTALARKDAFRQIDADNNGRMSTLEYLMWQFKKTMESVVDAPQGSSPELEEAQRALRKVQLAIDDAKRLELELRAAGEDLRKQEEAYANRIKLLEEKIANPASTTVQKSKASNELAQLKAEDPLPLRKAKLTQEAALRKVQKQQEKLMQELSLAQTAVDKAKATAKGGYGMLWWLQRELFEGDKYLPTAKQRFNHKEPFLYDPSK
jgi:hypothetical protein